MSSCIGWGTPTMLRADGLEEFYGLLARLEKRVGAKRRLADCHGRLPWPSRGVYFFFEDGENRATDATLLRIVRVGTHALGETSRTTLWNRLSQHRGVASTGAGNHRGSIFRALVGEALQMRTGGVVVQSWGIAGDLRTAALGLGLTVEAVKAAELPIEQAVSVHIQSMPFLWLDVDDPPGRENPRGYIERNAIALLSNLGKDPIDSQSVSWLGAFSRRERVRRSGLWNNNHVDENWDPGFLDHFAHLVEA